MAPEERRYTVDEWREIQAQYREQPRRGVRTMYPDPLDECELGPFVPEGGFVHGRGRAESPTPRHQPHVESWISTLSADDIAKLEILIALRPETVKWVAEKNSRELERLDGAVEFISSSRTAARVLMWVCGTAVAFVGGVVALAKSGFDAFALFRGLGK
ncbi:hypothetical protein [Methylobacterium sp. PvR107]|uniref:hypothetical protein n=1 Tax=Methylobacterium sp. PvR107 TaxID=2806597 RepID=UPI001AE39DE5|nr:hypothetical protein [Methylobacterium sp. PvR107]MBP1179955.1 hypothetical protein [Methylobacterium sp. PvR107]